MEHAPVHRFAVGPIGDPEILREVGGPFPVVATPDASGDLEAPHLLEAPDGLWLSTASADLRDHVARLLGASYVVVTLDCWSSSDKAATIGRFGVVRHLDGTVTSEMSERRHPDVARGGVLAEVAGDWLARKVQGLARPRSSGPTKKEVDQRLRAEQLLADLVERSLLELAPGSTIADLGDRTRRVLFVTSRRRPEAVRWLAKMFATSKHVATLRAGADDLIGALDRIGYRR